MFQFPLIELVDRFCIAKLKQHKLGNNDAELAFYQAQMDLLDTSVIADDLQELYDIHARIWEMEDDFKRGRIDNAVPLEEIGRRALAIRDINATRYVVKNRMVEKLGDVIFERKRYG